MTVPNILSNARALANMDSTVTGFSDSDLLPFLNMVYHEVESEIVRFVDEHYFTSEFHTNTVADQERYERNESTSTVSGFRAIKELWIKWKSTDAQYTVLKNNGVMLDNESNDVTATNSPGQYDIRGKYIHIYPTPTESVTEGLRVTASVNLVDLTTTSTEAEIFPDHTELRVYHDILVKGLLPYIYQIKGDTNRKNDARNEYKMELQEMLQQMKFKNGEVLLATEPSLAFYAG